ncbi:MAG: O-antigen ligase family protein [Chthoniobacter sp.]
MLAGYICALSLFGILVTGSRGGYISAAVGLMIFGLLSLVLRSASWLPDASSCCSSRVTARRRGELGCAPDQVAELPGEFTGQSDADRGHQPYATLAGGLKQFRLQPIVGTGSGTYLYYGRQFRSPEIHTDPVHAHNDYFELLAEYGLLEHHLHRHFPRDAPPQCVELLPAAHFARSQHGGDHEQFAGAQHRRHQRRRRVPRALATRLQSPHAGQSARRRVRLRPAR